MSAVPPPSAAAPPSVGRTEHEAVNRVLNEHLARIRPLVVAHRGTAIGSIAENTSAAAAAALASGADVVEIDVTESVDGAFFAFHDGAEPRLLGIEENLGRLTARQIRSLRYIHVERPGRSSPVEPLLDLLAGLRPADGTPPPLVNVDRSWHSWRTLLPALDELAMTGQLLLKSPADLAEPLEVLRRHKVKYPYLPICSRPDQLEAVLEDRELNTVGVELLADDLEHPFLDPELLGDLHRRGHFVLVNAEVLTNGVPLFAGHDDERAVLHGPDAGWGPLVDLGADMIQTDWPWLLSAYRESRAMRAAARSVDPGDHP